MNFTIDLPTIQTKQLSTREKRWEIQREIFSLLADDAPLKRENWKRYVTWMKRKRIDYQKYDGKVLEAQWKKVKDKDIRFIKPMSKQSFGFFTCHLDEGALWYVLSVCKDKINRNESPTCYVYSLQKFSTVSPDLLQKST